MAVLKINRFEIAASRKDLDRLFGHLQWLGVTEIMDAPLSDGVFFKPDTARETTGCRKNAELLAEAASIVSKRAARKKKGLAFLNGRDALTRAEYEEIGRGSADCLKLAGRVLELDREIAALRADETALRNQADALKPWLALPVPLSFAGTEKTRAFVGSLEGNRTAAGVESSLRALLPEGAAVVVAAVYEGTAQTNLLVVVLKRLADEAENALRQLAFVRPQAHDALAPPERLADIEARLAANARRVAAAQEELDRLSEYSERFERAEDYCAALAERHEKAASLIESEHAAVLSGYVPAKLADAFAASVRQAFPGAALHVSPTDKDDGDVPTLLENAAFSASFGGVLESYALPAKGEMDPTTVMSLFYFVMFGLMLSDAGYGLILTAVCGFIMLKYRNMEPGWRNAIRMFLLCGISTVFWGVMFGSWFGNAFTLVPGLFFGVEFTAANGVAGITKPLWFDPLNDPMGLLVFCMGVGLVHLSAGYLMKFVAACKSGKPIDGVWDGLAPLLLAYPLIIILMSTDMFYSLSGGFQIQLSLPPAATSACVSAAAACALAIVLFAGRESGGVAGRLLSGLYALYNTVAGWLSDLLSYSRLLALGLATGVIASVFNQLGAMGGGSVVGAVLFAAVFAVGQSLNFGINVLGAYVHSNRLEYVEFFGKFYEGGGRKWSPFSLKTKHVKVVE